MLRLTLLFCTIQLMALSASLTYQTLIPQFTKLWALSNTQAAWIASASYVAYAMSAPILVTLTDRIDAKRVLLTFLLLGSIASFGFALTADGFWSALFWRALTGVAIAGTYMPGLKALTDRLDDSNRGRYQAYYTASFSLGSGLSMLLAASMADYLGWRAAFWASGMTGLVGAWLVWWTVAAQMPAACSTTARLFDYRPILKDRSVMRYVAAYAGHSWELFAFRTWITAFLTAAAIASGTDIATTTIGLIAMALTSAGLPASILGNELASKVGRVPVLVAVMTLSGLLAGIIGFLIGLPFWLIVLAMSVYAMLVMADSAAITVGTLANAPAERRGAVIAVQTMLASLMAMISPLAVGLSLDMFGSDTAMGWGVAFLASGIGILAGAFALAWIRPSRSI